MQQSAQTDDTIDRIDVHHAYAMVATALAAHTMILEYGMGSTRAGLQRRPLLQASGPMEHQCLSELSI